LMFLSTKAFCMNILVSYFDPFDAKDNNNSEVVAKLIEENFKSKNIKLQTCKLRTVFDKAYDILQDCVNAQDVRPDLVISLGESGCKKITLETRGINLDKSIGPDNDGMERNNTLIDPTGEKYLGVTLPLEKAYCALTESQKKSFKISKSAGSFVCNNTLYNGLQKLDVPYTFIHVPGKNCTSDSIIKILAKDLSDYIELLSIQTLTGVVQPKSKNEVKAKLKTKLTACEEKFYKKLKKDY